MSKDQRRTRRRPLRRPAWVALSPNDLRECVLFDVSDDGARIELDDTRDIPDQFILFLSRNGAARRNCKVAWRQGRQIGLCVRRAPTESRSNRKMAIKVSAEDVSHEPAETT